MTFIYWFDGNHMDRLLYPNKCSSSRSGDFRSGSSGQKRRPGPSASRACPEPFPAGPDYLMISIQLN